MKKLKLSGVMELCVIQLLLGLLPVLYIFILVLNVTHNHFTYALDDPYIHLALAKNIGLGHYGININEACAPSSSIIWPFLLAPFARFAVFEYTPFFINLVCLNVLVYVLHKLFSGKPFFLKLLLIGVVLLSVNAYGLVFIGMEHSLQILLAGIIAISIATLADNSDPSAKPAVVSIFIYFAVILLPMVRYEGLAIALPVLLYLFLKGDRKRAAIALCVMLTGVLGFSGYLHHLNLGLLPSSVLVKSSHTSLHATIENLLRNIDKYGFMLLPISLLCGYYWGKDRALALLIFAVTLLHFTFGKYGWFGRFEAYWLIFILIFCFHRLMAQINESCLCYIPLLMVPFAFWSLVLCTLNTPVAAANIYNQQAQTAKIAQILAEPVAVNDLGLVALRSKQYVLDLWGLGNLETLKLWQSGIGSQWIADLMTRKGIKYAFIYDKWFPVKPSSWLKVAELKLINQEVLLWSDTVSYYAVDSQSKEKLAAAITKLSSVEKPVNFSVKMY